jgi:hypothetical protein
MPKGDVLLVCVECVRLVGIERAEWASVYRGDKGYCPAHVPPTDGSTDA